MILGRASLLGAVVLIWSIGAASAKPTTVVAEVNLRDTPSLSGKILTLIPKGTSVELATCDNGWCQVTYNGQQGYAISKNLGEAQPAPAPAPKKRVVRRPVPQAYAGGPPVYDPGPVYVGPPPPYAYYGYYSPYYYGPYFGPRFGWGWRGGWGFRHRW